jgi:hypothetical protein
MIPIDEATALPVEGVDDGRAGAQPGRSAPAGPAARQCGHRAMRDDVGPSASGVGVAPL